MNDFLRVAIRAVRAAGKVVMKYYTHEFRVDFKSDNSPVTVADMESERLIIDVIKKAFPSHGFITEESGSRNVNAEYKWIIDPLDGTKNFMRGIPLFGVLIALMKGDELILGVSYAPALKELIYAFKSEGAFFNGKKIHVSSVDSLSKAYISYGGLNLFDKHKLIPSLVSLVNSCMARRGLGDFWSYNLLARGCIDLFVEPDTKLWDIAAVSLIVQEAGGNVTDLKGVHVGLNTTSIIATNGLLHEVVLNFFK